MFLRNPLGRGPWGYGIGKLIKVQEIRDRYLNKKLKCIRGQSPKNLTMQHTIHTPVRTVVIVYNYNSIQRWLTSE